MFYSVVENEIRGDEEEECFLVNDVINCIFEGEGEYFFNLKLLLLEVGKYVVELWVELIVFDVFDGLCIVNIIGIIYVLKVSWRIIIIYNMGWFFFVNIISYWSVMLYNILL